MASSELSDADVFGSPAAGSKELSDADVFAGPASARPENGPGDIRRGVATAFRQTPQLFGGVVGALGAAGEKLLGEGGISTDVKEWGLGLHNDIAEEIGATAKPSDDFEYSLNAAKSGDLGPLADYLQYQTGYFGGQAAETLGIALAGGVAGGLAGGPGGLVAGGLSGLVAKRAMKMALKELGDKAAEAEVKALAKQMLPKAARQVAGDIGAVGALTGYNVGQELGQIYPMAEEQAAKEGRTLTGEDLAKAAGLSGISAGTETASDIIPIAALLGRITLPGPSGRIAKGLTAGTLNAALQGGQEGVQTVLERAGAGMPLDDEATRKDVLESAVAPTFPSFMLAAITGGLAGGGQKTDVKKPGQPSAAPGQPPATAVTPGQGATSDLNDLKKPSDAQIGAGNYQKGHAKLSGFDISIENEHGSIRRSKEDAEQPWTRQMFGDYGYFKGVPARAPDKDHVDVMIFPNTPKNYDGPAFIVDQVDSKGNFDEPKVIQGVRNVEDAMSFYLRNYPNGWNHVSGISQVTQDDLKEMLDKQSSFMGEQPNAMGVKFGSGENPYTFVRKNADRSGLEVQFPREDPNAKRDQLYAKATARLNKNLSAYWKDTLGKEMPTEIIPSAFSAPMQDMVDRFISPLFKVNVVPIRGRKPGASPQIHGVTDPGVPNTIFINTDMTPSEAFAAVSMHEVVHDMEKRAPDLFSDLVTALREMGDQDGFMRFGSSYSIPGQPSGALSEEGLRKELTANIVGDAARRPEFWTRMRDHLEKTKPGVFIKLAKYIRDMLGRLLQITGQRGFGSEQYVKDVAATHAAVAKAMAGYVERLRDGAPAALKAPAPAVQTDQATVKQPSSNAETAAAPAAPVVEPEKPIQAPQAEPAPASSAQDQPTGADNGLQGKEQEAPEEVKNAPRKVWRNGEEVTITSEPYMLNGAEVEDGVTESGKTVTMQTQAQRKKNDEEARRVRDEQQAAFRRLRESQQKAEAEKKAAAEPKPEPKHEPKASENTVFTEEAYLAARERMRKRLSQLNVGVDPQMMMDGFMMAGYHIEHGARTFAAYSKAMIADLGDGVRPFLKAIYNGVRDYPGFNSKGMTSHDEVANTDVNDIGVDDEQGQTDSASAGTLDNVPPGQGSVTGGDGGSGGEPAGSGGDGAAGSERTGAAGSSDARGGEPSDAGPHLPPAGTGGGNTGLGRKGNRGTRKKLPKERSPVPTVAPEDRPSIPATNFVITEEFGLGKGGEVQKYNDNIAAIETLRAIEGENRRATPEEQAILARFVGWGGLQNAFQKEDGTYSDGWEERAKALESMLTKEEFAAARNSTRNAHYTSETIVRAMWEAVRRLGYKGGLVLESSMGTGNFIGMMPADVAEGAKFIGVERDSLTARIAALLYPHEAVFQAGFQTVPMADGEFVLNIGNPPYGNESLHFQYRPEINGLPIHAQFIVAGLDSLIPGGLQAVVVSRYLMDRKDATPREEIAKRARLLGAIRLPDTAFKENARTEVVTDILFLQRLTAAEQREMEDAFAARDEKPKANMDKERARKALAAKVPEWVNTGSISDPLGGDSITVNDYYRYNPQMIVGQIERSGSMRQKGDVTVRYDGDIGEALRGAIQELPEGVLNVDEQILKNTVARHAAMADALRIVLGGRENGHLELDADGNIVQIAERETPSGGMELYRRKLTPESPWSEKLFLDKDGNWYSLEAELDDKGQKKKTANKRNVYQRHIYQPGKIPTSLLLGQTRYDRLRPIVQMRDMIQRQIDLEREDAPTEEIERHRALLRSTYRGFVSAHGLLHDNLTLFGGMPDSGLVMSLEHNYKRGVSEAVAKRTGEKVRGPSADEADILSKRVVEKYEPPTAAASAQDALAISLGEFGRVNIDRIASLLGKTHEEVVAEMHDNLEKPMIFFDPEERRWVTAPEYLSGQVARKLDAARAAGAEKNIAALEAVQPAPWTAEHITPVLGSAWVDARHYGDFLSELLGAPFQVRYSRATNTYDVVQMGKTDKAKEATWGSQNISAAEIVSAILNSRAVRVTSTDADGHERFDLELTELAKVKANEIKVEFEDWIFKDSKRRNELVEAFNKLFNTLVLNQHDGSHLTLPGKVPDDLVKLTRSQRNGVWRGIMQRFVLYDHTVGAGKTMLAIARAMERKRMGLSKKPMIVVPNHLVLQWASEVYRLYPAAKILYAGSGDFQQSRRRRLFGKIATGTWDIVIVPHSSFKFIGISRETETRYLTEELQLARQAVADAEEESGYDGSGFRKPPTVKEAERLVTKIEERLAALRDVTRDRLLTFEQMGVDDLTVDESHLFKNLFYSSRLSGVRGLGSKGGSQRSLDLYNKIRILRERGGSAAFLSGTPISNSAVEMYTVMRYLAADQLVERGIEHFDAWRSQFVSVDTKYEPTEDGVRLKEVDRLGRHWSNMRSLMDLYHSFTDSVTNDDIAAAYQEENGVPYPLPRVAGGSRREVVVKPTEAQLAALQDILHGFDHLPYISNPIERGAERLRLMSRAMKVSLDARFENKKSTSKEEGGKLDTIAGEVARIYRKWDADAGTQLIFLDRGVKAAKGDDKKVAAYDAAVKARDKALASGDQAAFAAAQEKLDEFNPQEIEELRAALAGGWNAYDQIKQNLINLGIPAHEIRFIGEANTDAQRKTLFDSVKDGAVRVLIGSTEKMGAGTNVQDRLVALHHADVTWKPSDIEQREGRIVRRGNKLLEKYGMDNFEVEILAYVTERTIDAKLWDLNATKLRMINGIRKYDGSFNMDFDDEDSVGMEMIAAAAAGSPLRIEQVKLKGDIEKLELQKRAHTRKMHGAESAVEEAESIIKNYPGYIEKGEALSGIAKDALAQTAKEASERRVTVAGKQYDSVATAMEAAKAAIEEELAKPDAKNKYSIIVDGKPYTNKMGIEGAITKALGDQMPFSADVNGKHVTRRSDLAEALVEIANSGANTRGSMHGGLVLDMQFKGDGVALDLYSPNMERLVASDFLVLPADGQFSVAKMRSSISRLEDQVVRLRSFDRSYYDNKIKEAGESLPALRSRLGEPFKYAADLAAARTRLEQVTKELAGTATAAPPSVNEKPFRAVPSDGGGFSFWNDKVGLINPTMYALDDGGGTVYTYQVVDAEKYHELEDPGDVGRVTVGTAQLLVMPDGSISAVEKINVSDNKWRTAIEGAVKNGQNGLDAGRQGQATQGQGQVPGAPGAPQFAQVEPGQGIDPRGAAAAETIVAGGGSESRWVAGPAVSYSVADGNAGPTYATKAPGEQVGGGVSSGWPPDGVRRRSLASDMNSQSEWLSAQAAERGFDSVDQFLAQDPDGFFEVAAQWRDDNPADVMFSQALSAERFDLSSIKRGLTEAFTSPRLALELFKTDRRISRVWKSINTPYHIAQTNPELRPTFNETQAALADVQLFVNEAADLAQDVVPRVTNYRDALPVAFGGKQYASNKEIENVSKALNAGTLYGGGNPMDGVIWTKEELQGKKNITRPHDNDFNLTDREVAMYEQFLAAVANSTENLAKSIIWQQARRLKIDLNRNLGIGELIDGLREKVRERVEELKLRAEHAMQELDGSKRKARLNQIETEVKLYREMLERADGIRKKTEGLILHGYVPLMRFGPYAVYAYETDEKGKEIPKWFSRHEHQADANLTKRRVQEMFPNAQVKGDMMNEETYKLFQGQNIPALEVFAEHVVKEDGTKLIDDPLMQQYFIIATAERSTMKRLIHRKGTPGFSPDAPRVLAQFIASNARATSMNYHAAEMLRRAAAIKDGDLGAYAIQLIKYVMEPEEEAPMVRSFLASWFILGSPAAAAVNMTQPVMITAPYLSQHVGIAKAASITAKAMRDYVTGSIPDEFRNDMDRAEKEGHISPQEIHQLLAEARGGGLAGGAAGLAWRKLTFQWSGFYAAAEQFNRGTTFLAALRVAKEIGVADPYEFAVQANNDTNFIYNRGNRMMLSRSAIGAVVLTFKSFTVSYLELAKRLLSTKGGRPAFAWMMLGLFAAAGAEGMPFAEDIEDLIDTIGQWLGFGTNTKRAVREFAVSILGPDIAEAFLHGLPAGIGLPFDISNRVGMQNILPGSAMLKVSSDDKTRDIIEFAGPIGAVFKSGLYAAQDAATGKFGDATAQMLPKALKDVYKGGQMLLTGEYRDGGGGLVVPDVSVGDALFKSIGFQPKKVADMNRAKFELQQDIAMQRVMEKSIATDWARAILDKDQEGVRDAITRMNRWNRLNPSMRVEITNRQLRQRVQNLSLDAQARQIKNAPREMRSQIQQAWGLQ